VLASGGNKVFKLLGRRDGILAGTDASPGIDASTAPDFTEWGAIRTRQRPQPTNNDVKLCSDAALLAVVELRPDLRQVVTAHERHEE
jgi:hypothetical protein